MCNKIVTINGKNYQTLISDSGSEFFCPVEDVKVNELGVMPKGESIELFKDKDIMPGFIVCHNCGKVTHSIDAPQKEEDVHSHAYQSKPSKATTGGVFCACGQEAKTMLVNFNYKGQPVIKAPDISIVNIKHEKLDKLMKIEAFIAEGLENDSRTIWDFFYKTIKGRGFAYTKAVHGSLLGWKKTAPADLGRLYDVVMFKTSALRNPSVTTGMVINGKLMSKSQYRDSRIRAHADAYYFESEKARFMDKAIAAYDPKDIYKTSQRNARKAKFYLDATLGYVDIWTMPNGPAYVVIVGHSHHKTDATSIVNWKKDDSTLVEDYIKYLKRKVYRFLNKGRLESLTKKEFWALKERCDKRINDLVLELAEKNVEGIMADNHDAKGSENPLECGYLDDAALWRTQFVAETSSDDVSDIDSEVDMGSDGDDEGESEEVLNLEYYADSASFGGDDGEDDIMMSITEVGMEISNELGKTILVDNHYRHIRPYAPKQAKKESSIRMTKFIENTPSQYMPTMKVSSLVRDYDPTRITNNVCEE